MASKSSVLAAAPEPRQQRSAAPTLPGGRLLRTLTGLLGAGAALRGVGGADDTFGSGIGAPRLALPEPPPWYAAAFAPAPARVPQAAAPGPVGAAAQAARDATNRYVLDTDKPPLPDTCSPVESAAAPLAYLFSRKRLHTELYNFTSQPDGDELGTVEWRPLPAGTPLFAGPHGGRPAVREIRQSINLGDCYFLGALASLTAARPDFVKQNIVEVKVPAPLPVTCPLSPSLFPERSGRRCL